MDSTPATDDNQQPSPRRRSFLRFLPRWSAPTWRIVLFTAVVLFFVEVPGRRTGPTTYAHGWPFAYLERDYIGDPAVLAANANWKFSAGTPEWAEEFRDAWNDDQVPFVAEAAMTPWTFAGTISRLIVAADALVALMLLGIVGWARERWRRHRSSPAKLRFFQFRLRTLLLAVPLVAFACAKIAAWHNDYLAERQSLESVSGAIGPFFVECEVQWKPPHWMPECLLKLGLQNWFAHVVAVRGRVDSDVLKFLGNFNRLQKLDCAAEKNSDFAPLTRLSQLSELRIEGDGVTRECLKQLAALPRLRKLAIVGALLDDAALAELNGLASLEELEVNEQAAQILDLHGLKELRALRLRRFRAPLIRLTDLPRLANIELNGATLDAVSCQNISALPALASLKINDATTRDPLVFDGCPKLASFEFVASEIGAAPWFEWSARQVLKRWTFVSPRLTTFLADRLAGCPP